MTQEDKDLLLKDLSARLPYGVRISKAIDDFVSEPKLIKSLYPDGTILVEDEFPDVDAWDICEIKPYLRPLSSMTAEESKEYYKTFWYRDESSIGNYGEGRITLHSFDWLLEHHFDFRGLIEKGLALEAPKDMYVHLKT